MRYFVVDAFTDQRFRGNPAGVCLPEHPLGDPLMQAIAAENNLAETAFVLPAEEGYALRWFTPTREIDLCGHATLASAFVISQFSEPGADRIDFFSKSGKLSVTRRDDLYEMDFPARAPDPIAVTEGMRAAVGCEVLEAHLSRDVLLLVTDEAAVQALAPDMEQIRQLSGHGVIVTARGENADFVSRFFAPNMGVPEDHVTGSSHCTLIPFWAARLGKTENETMTARQLSRRGGTLYCKNSGARVRIAGRAVLYLRGELTVD
ncbi:MAG: PhzF family phenazine biosynthesis protein [Oscillospiraceae bacterium]|jgi:PhzF family phenazine biosynthesis protein|nr:PhzF family phenazine biosynthesis protein [Oscillospiraceae bacterium]